ncbi:hypothetical protein SAMN02800692_1998 [Luteibacter sp. UNC138MFCol5.1]|uniref:DUF2184 domain-containing protein n=1 Tax=Luteibacter sp. UNC138MFCol5.1 TaxID=1502774 RepID=UPI0008D08C58|nr:major capsid family protein [Luteibacter sp. UNC138MFCol5.1]SEO76435.1 hypothetical protein SAMN02800692_1998 [Luteibacter sp. UNC138MFCol5.1]
MNHLELRRRQVTDAVARALAGSPGLTNDAPEAMAFVVSQLAHVESTVYKREHQPLQYEELVPIDTSAGDYATSVVYEMYDYAGRGKRHSGRGKDIPKVDVAYAQKTVPVVLGVIGYDYSTEELRQSAFLRKPLDTARAEAAMDAYERHINDVALFGENELTGLFNNPYVPVVAPSVTGWIGKDPDVVNAAFSALITQVWTNSKYVEMPTTVLLPGTVMAWMVSTRVPNTTMNLLQYIKANNIAKSEKNIDLDIRTGYDLDTAGAGGTKRAMVYTKNPSKLKMHLPMPIKFLPPQANGLLFEVPGEYKYSGVEFIYPKSALYADGL